MSSRESPIVRATPLIGETEYVENGRVVKVKRYRLKLSPYWMFRAWAENLSPEDASQS